MADNADGNDVVIDEANSEAVAAAMGFAQFGMQGGPPAKRRRFHQQAGVVVATAPPAPHPAVATHAVVVPPAAAMGGAHPPANADEIDLDDADEDEGGAEVTAGDRRGNDELPQPVQQGGDVDTTDPDPADAAADQLDGNAHSTGRPHHHHHHLHIPHLHRHLSVQRPDRHGFRPELMPGSGDQGGGLSGSDGASGVGADGAQGVLRGLPPPPATAHQGGLPNPPLSMGPAPHQQPDAPRPWWTDYYDPLCNENPWAELEAERGLPPSGGQWLKSGHTHPDGFHKRPQQGGGARGGRGGHNNYGRGRGQQGPRHWS